MRSNSFVKRTFPCLAVIIAVSLQGAPAQAGFFDKLKASASQFFGNTTAPTKKQTQTAPTTNKATPVIAATAVSPELAFVNQVISEAHSDDGFGITSLRSASMSRAEKVSHVSSSTHTEIVPEYTDKGLVFKFRYDDHALKNPELMVKDLATLAFITSTANYNGMKSTVFSGQIDSDFRKEVESPHAIAELLMNMREGSPTARARWTSLQAELLRTIHLKNSYIQSLKLSSNVISNARETLLASLPQQEAAAQQYVRKQQKELEKWRSETGALNKMEAMQDKLDDLILKNDRKAVRQMLDAYLPWPVMEPVEANTWRIWLDAIENPDWSKTTIAFRGLKYDTDKVQRRQTSQGEIYGFMSTVLTKNQGSYTRRLRSLTTNRDKNGDVGFALHGEKVRSAKITDQMTAHAKNPVASSFLSFTYSPSVAYRFMGVDIAKVDAKGETRTVANGGILVVKMDSRRLIPNLPSMYATEIELLAPLIVFPDEVVKYKEGSFNSDYTFQNFVEEITKKTGYDFNSWYAGVSGDEKSLQHRYKSEGFAFLKKMMAVDLKSASCSKIF